MTIDFRTRRAVLGAGAAAALVFASAGRAFAKPRTLPIGLGLFTVQDELQKDLAGTLKAIAAMGYREVEISLFDKPPAKLLRQLLDEHGLIATSTHLTPGQEAQDMEFAHIIGSKYVVAPAPAIRDPSQLRPADSTPAAMGAAYAVVLAGFALEDWRWNADRLNRLGSEAKSNGFRLAYHTHGIDFKRYGTDSALDVTLRGTDPGLVWIQLDVGWAVNAGIDPVALLRNNGSRIAMLHVKDVAKGFVPSTGFRMDSPAVGEGAVQWPALLAAAAQAGVRHCYVEVEPPYGGLTAMQAAASSKRYLDRLSL